MKKRKQDKKDAAVLIGEQPKEKQQDVIENRDPITKEPGSHPVGVAAGGTGGAAAGTAIGTAIGGPIGGVIGAAAGAIAGSLAGKGVAEAVNPSEEEEYWQEYYKTRPYYRSDLQYEKLAPGYRFGWESAARPQFRGKTFQEVEEQLKSEWPSYYSTGEFADYREATKDAYERVQRRLSESEKRIRFPDSSYPPQCCS